MTRIGKSMSREHPQLEANAYGSLSAGSAADPATDTCIVALPEKKLYFGQITENELDASSEVSNHMTVREASLISQGTSNTTGNATHNADLRLNLYRKGVLQGCLGYYSLSVNTTIGTAVTSGNVNTKLAVTPASMTGIVAGMRLAIDTSTSLEYVDVLSVTSTTFTAIFTKTHTTSAAVTSVLVPNYPIPLVHAVGVNTNSGSSTVGSAGSTTITPVTMYGIRVGDSLLCDTGGSQETVVVTAVTATTFTATFANTHSAAFAILTSQPAGGYQTPRWPVEIKGGDVVALGRVSNDSTGIATPAMVVILDWVPYNTKI